MRPWRATRPSTTGAGYRNEQALDEAPADIRSGADPGVGSDVGPQESATRIERSAEARLFVERFPPRRPARPKWAGVFEMRFLAGLDQRTAAARLGIGRTTLAYREVQVRRLLGRFVRQGATKPEPEITGTAGKAPRKATRKTGVNRSE